MPQWREAEPFTPKRDNLLFGLLHRETHSGRPGAGVHRARTLYERITPSTSLNAIDAPDCHVRKFTDDGQLLVRGQRLVTADLGSHIIAELDVASTSNARASAICDDASGRLEGVQGRRGQRYVV